MPDLQVNSQVGQPITALLPPDFDGFEIVENSWKPKNLLKDKDHTNVKGVIFNTTMWGPGTEVDCEMMQYDTDPPATPLQKGMVVPEKAPNAANLWFVKKADPSNYGPDGIIYSVTLRRTPDQDLTQQRAADPQVAFPLP